MQNPTDYSAWPVEALRRERIFILNEIAFRHGDAAHGGPRREDEIAALRRRLEQIGAALKA